MSVHYSPQQQVLRNISVGKTPITVNVSSVEHGGDYTVHNGASAVYPSVAPLSTQQHKVAGESASTDDKSPPISEYVPPPPGFCTCPHCQCIYPSTQDTGLPRTIQERSIDLSVGLEEDKYKTELEGIVHQIFANMALQHQTPHMRKLTGNHIVLPREDLITVVAYTVGCSPSEVRINQGFHDVGCLSKNDGMTLVDSIKIGIKDLYLAYNDKYNLLEDVYHISLHYCFDLDAKGKPRNRVAISYG